MGTMSKKLYVKQTNGTVAGCNIYTTAAEAGDKALKVRADGVAGYVALKPITDANATAGRISIGGVTYAIATQHTAAVSVPYTEKSWTKAGSYTFTVPDGVSRVRVAVCGGGAGKAVQELTVATAVILWHLALRRQAARAAVLPTEKALAVSLTAMRLAATA